MRRYSPEPYERGCDLDPYMTPDPAGEWFHERDPVWERIWISYGGKVGIWYDDCRADVLLSLDRALLAWGRMKAREAFGPLPRHRKVRGGVMECNMDCDRAAPKIRELEQALAAIKRAEESERSRLRQLIRDLADHIETVAPDSSWWEDELADRVEEALSGPTCHGTGESEGE